MHSTLLRTLRTRANYAYARITLNRVTTAFFIFSFVHCFAQGIIQSFLFSIDSEYYSLLFAITNAATISPQNITYLEGTSGNFDLKMCSDIPYGYGRTIPCTDIFLSKSDSSLNSGVHQTFASNPFEHGLSIATNSKHITGVTITSGSITLPLTLQCTQILIYPEQIMRNSKREDITFILLQFWLFAISIIAIMSDSVPHVLAVLITRALSTAWSIYAIWRTKYIESVMHELIFKSGTPCSVNIFPTYFSTRVSYEIPDLILNCTALIIACYLSWTLLQNYNTQSFKCVGAPEHINRINKFFMAVLACLQLEAFVLVAALGLWIDVLVNTAIARLSLHTPVYKALIIGSTICLIPWITMGWYAIRREMKILMVIFLGVAFLIITGWSLMFYSIVYRWTFVQWPYFGCFTVASLVLIIATMILGTICRLNFGKGFAQYLYAEAALASSNFAPEVFSHDEEKGTMDLNRKIPFEQPQLTYEGEKDNMRDLII